MAYPQQPYFNTGYYPQYQNGAVPDILSQYKAPQFPIATRQTNDIIWVQGESGAKAYLVAPNNTVTLWDSESPTIYVKTADVNGIPSMRVLDFVERPAIPQRTNENGSISHECKCGKDFVKIEAFNELKAKYEDLEGIVKSLVEKKEETENG